MRIPDRRTLATLLVCSGIALGSGGVSLLLWGSSDTAGSAPASSIGLGVIPPSGGDADAAQTKPAAAPVHIDLPSVHISSAVIPLQLQGDGTLEVPADPGVAGWWSGGSAPGEQGPAVIVGHIDSVRGPAVFYGVPALRPGDRVRIGRADGSTVEFAVDALRQYPKSAFPTDLVYGPTTQPTLRLVTCGGSFSHGSGYSDDVVVFAHLVPPAVPHRSDRSAV